MTTGQRRIERIGRQLRAELGHLIATDLDDPRIRAVTVTHVQVSRDLRHARVFVSGLGTEADRRATLAGLNSARGFLRRQLSMRLSHMARTPELVFDYDASIETGMRIEELLSEISDVRDDRE